MPLSTADAADAAANNTTPKVEEMDVDKAPKILDEHEHELTIKQGLLGTIEANKREKKARASVLSSTRKQANRGGYNSVHTVQQI